VFIPYQTSVMSFFEQYRQNIPMFAPALSLLVTWHQRFKILSPRVYGRPARPLDLIANTSAAFRDIPDPNDDMNETSNIYWLRFADIYTFPHIVLFRSTLTAHSLTHSLNSHSPTS
jgi:hypothetical protein